MMLTPLKILDTSLKAKLKGEELNEQGNINPIPIRLFSQARIYTHQDGPDI